MSTSPEEAEEVVRRVDERAFIELAQLRQPTLFEHRPDALPLLEPLGRPPTSLGVERPPDTHALHCMGDWPLDPP
jgi:hypothetical protein